jgi:hypothetical protein
MDDFAENTAQRGEKMPAKKKSGQTYIRMGPDVHTRVAKVAKALDMDINGVLNLCVRLNLPQLEQLVNADQTDDPRKKASVLRLFHALTEFSAALMAASEHVTRGIRDPLGKATIEHFVGVMYDFAEAVRKTPIVTVPQSMPISEPSTEGEQSTQPQERSERP